MGIAVKYKEFYAPFFTHTVFDRVAEFFFARGLRTIESNKEGMGKRGRKLCREAWYIRTFKAVEAKKQAIAIVMC